MDRNFANDANELLKEKSREIVALGTEYQKSKDDMSMAMKTLQTKIEKLESENSQLQSTVYKLQDKNLVWLSTYLTPFWNTHVKTVIHFFYLDNGNIPQQTSHSARGGRTEVGTSSYEQSKSIAWKTESKFNLRKGRYVEKVCSTNKWAPSNFVKGLFVIEITT